MCEWYYLAHNHPGSQLSLGEADIRLTRKIVEGGKLLGIEVHDHIIFSAYGYYRFGDEWMM
ncbi:JAB domain-containing protein [Pedobacter agri]|uniref:JAB domain-containing protein n=1 Tax=Pedobacter agri TaxID=454586 RepID=UPI0039779F51